MQRYITPADFETTVKLEVLDSDDIVRFTKEKIYIAKVIHPDNFIFQLKYCGERDYLFYTTINPSNFSFYDRRLSSSPFCGTHMHPI